MNCAVDIHAFRSIFPAFLIFQVHLGLILIRNVHRGLMNICRRFSRPMQKDLMFGRPRGKYTFSQSICGFHK